MVNGTVAIVRERERESLRQVNVWLELKLNTALFQEPVPRCGP